MNSAGYREQICDVSCVEEGSVTSVGLQFLTEDWLAVWFDNGTKNDYATNTLYMLNLVIMLL